MNRFELGKVTVSEATDHTLQKLKLSAVDFLTRHQNCDWGDISDHFQAANERALQLGLMIASRYLLGKDDQGEDVLLLIETAADRSHTVVTLRSERNSLETDLLEGYAMWADTYAREKNLLVETEEPIFEKILDELYLGEVLDVGTGTGRWAHILAQRGAKVTAIDQSSEMLWVAQVSAKKKGLNIDFHELSLWDELPFQAGQFDLITSGLMFSHIDDLAGAFAKFYNLLAPGGKLLFSAFHPDALAHGWRTAIRRPGIKHALHNSDNTRVDYIEALADTGYRILKFIDIPIIDLPPTTFPPIMNPAFRFLNVCLIVLAEKPED